MDALDSLFHLLSFFAPAFAVALGTALAARLIAPRQSGAGSWWRSAAINFVAGGLVLAAGLWFFGVDGKMATYAILLIAVATTQWICSRAWRN